MIGSTSKAVRVQNASQHLFPYSRRGEDDVDDKSRPLPEDDVIAERLDVAVERLVLIGAENLVEVPC